MESINEFLLPDLGTVSLIPGLKTGATEPSSLPSTVTVMASPIIVASKKYIFSYNAFRLLRLGYVLERNGNYEHGEFFIYSKAVYKTALDPATYAIPTLATTQTILQTDGSINVSLGVATDSSSLSSDPSFGITYRITNASPNVFPTLRVYIVKGLPLKENKHVTT